MVETGLREVPVLPSEGTHFFQNLTPLGIGYFTIPNGDPESFVDYDWLDGSPRSAKPAFSATSGSRIRSTSGSTAVRRGLILKQPIGTSR